MENNQHKDPIRQTLENHQVTPSADVWNRIQSQLDMDAAAFDSGNRQRFFWYAGSLLTAAAVMLFAWYTIEQPDMEAYRPIGMAEIAPNLYHPEVADSQYNMTLASSDESSVVSQEENLQTTTLATNHSAVSNTRKTVSNNQIESNQLADQSGTDLVEDASLINQATSDDDGIIPEDHTGEEPTDQLALTDEDQDTTSDETSVTDQDLADATAEESVEEVEQAQLAEEEVFESIEPIESIRKEKNPFHGFYMGVAGGWYASTLLTGKEIVINDNPITTGMRFGPSKGISAGYVFKNVSVQAEYLYNVVQGQNYYMDVEGTTRTKNMSLYFDQIPIMVKLRTPRYNDHFKIPASLNIMAGTQLNILKDYQIPQERQYDTDEDIFRKTTFSLLAGAEYEVMVNKHIMLSLGVEGTLSENFSTTSDPIGDFPKHSLSAGAKGGIYYLIPTK